MAVRPNRFIEKLDPYKITTQEPWNEKDRKAVLKLDWNEATFVPSFIRDFAIQLLKSDEYFNWYPDYNAHQLHKALAESLGVSVMEVLSFPGSDAALEALCRCYLAPRFKAVAVTPSYSNFFVFAKSIGASVNYVSIPKPFCFDLDMVINKTKKVRGQLLYLVTPNNPCGYFIDPTDVSKICDLLPDVLIVCDQAYVEFATYADCVHLISDHPNLIIVRTFSKAYSLAGMRVGYVVAQHEILKNLSKIRNGKNLIMLAQKLAIECLKHPTWLEDWVKEIIREKEKLYKILDQFGIPYYHSHGNFVLFELSSPKKTVAELKKRRIFIRDQSEAIEGGVRVTIGHSSAMKRFANVLQEIISEDTRGVTLRGLS